MTDEPTTTKDDDESTTEATRPTRLDDAEVSPDALRYVHDAPSPLEETLTKRIERRKSHGDTHTGADRPKT